MPHSGVFDASFIVLSFMASLLFVKNRYYLNLGLKATTKFNYSSKTSYPRFLEQNSYLSECEPFFAIQRR